MYANPSIFKVSECPFYTDGVKQVSQVDVILLSSQGLTFSEVKEGLKYLTSTGLIRILHV